MMIGMSITILQSSRIQFVALKAEDAELFSRWSEDAEYLRNLDTDYAMPRSADYYREQIQGLSSQNNTIELGIRLMSDQRLIGFISLHSIEWNNRSGRLAIGIGEKDCRHIGLGTEAIQLLMKYAFHELNLHRLGLDVISNNPSAIRSYEKAGFVVEGRIRESVLRDGQILDRIYMGLLRSDWEVNDGNSRHHF